MSKPLPYFKFNVDDWLLGKIIEMPPSVQGRFITFCAQYWRRNCDVSEQFYYKSLPKTTRKLLESESVIEVKLNQIRIKFLDEQYVQLSENQKLASKAGRASAIARASTDVATDVQPLKNKEVEVDIYREKGTTANFIRAMYEDESWNISIRQLYPRLRKGDNVLMALNHFTSFCEASKTTHENAEDCRSHFARWMKYQKNEDIPGMK